jgi:hypothetical protein
MRCAASRGIDGDCASDAHTIEIVQHAVRLIQQSPVLITQPPDSKRRLRHLVQQLREQPILRLDRVEVLNECLGETTQRADHRICSGIFRPHAGRASARSSEWVAVSSASCSVAVRLLRSSCRFIMLSLAAISNASLRRVLSWSPFQCDGRRRVGLSGAAPPDLRFCLMPAADRPDPFIAVKISYRSLKQTSDEQVMALIERARTQRQEPA